MVIWPSSFMRHIVLLHNYYESIYSYSNRSNC
jgi:hypothetical protein